MASQDAEALAREEAERERRSSELVAEFTQRFSAAETSAELQRIGKVLTPAAKAHFTAADLDRVRRAYGARQNQLQPANVAVTQPSSDKW